MSRAEAGHQHSEPVGRFPRAANTGQGRTGGNMGRTILLAAALLTAVLSFAQTRAQTEETGSCAAETAAAHYAKGESLFQAGKFAEAVESFRQSTLLAPGRRLIQARTLRGGHRHSGGGHAAPAQLGRGVRQPRRHLRRLGPEGRGARTVQAATVAGLAAGDHALPDDLRRQDSERARSVI